MATAKSTIELQLNLDSSNASKGVENIDKNTQELLNHFSTLQRSAIAFNKELQKTNSDISQINKNGILKNKFSVAQKAAVDFNTSLATLSKHLNQVQNSFKSIGSSKFIDDAAKQQIMGISDSVEKIRTVANQIQPINITEGNITSDLSNVFSTANELKTSITQIQSDLKGISRNIDLQFNVDVDEDLAELKKFMMGDSEVDIDFNADGLSELKSVLSDINQNFDKEIQLEVDGVTFQKNIEDLISKVSGEKVDVEIDTSSSKFKGEFDKINKAIEKVKSEGGSDIKDFSSTTKRELNSAQEEANETSDIFSSLASVLGGLGDSVPGLSGVGDAIGGIGEKIGSLGGSGGGGLLGALGGAGGALAVTGVGAAVAGAAAAIGAGISQINEDVSQLRETRKMVFQFTGLTGEELNKAAANVQSLAKSYDTSAESITEAARALAGNRDISFEGATQFVEEALASGADEETLNQLREYDIQFKKAGLSIKDSIQAIRIGTEEGIYDDKFPDSIKEFGLRLNELGTDTEAAQKRLAPLGKEFFEGFQNDLQEGSMTTVEAAQQIFDRMDEIGLSSTQRETMIADLFGAAGEDAGRVVEVFDKLNNPITSLIEDNKDLEKSFEDTFTTINEQLQSGAIDTEGALSPLGEDFINQFQKSVDEGRDSEKLIQDIIDESLAQGMSVEAAKNMALQIVPPDQVQIVEDMIGKIAEMGEERGKVTALARKQNEAELEYQQKLADTQLQQSEGFSKSLDFAKTKVMTVFLDIYNSIVGESVGGIGDIIFEIADNITAVTDPIVEYLNIIVDYVGELFGLVGDIFGAVGSIIEPIIDIFSSAEDATEGIKEEGSTVKTIMSAIGSVIQTIVDRLRIVFGVLKFVVNVASTLAKVIGFVVGSIVRFVANTLRLREIWQGITGIFDDIKQAIVDTFSDRNNPIIKFFERTYNAVRRIVNRLGGELQTFDELMEGLTKKEEERQKRREKAQDSEGDRIKAQSEAEAKAKAEAEATAAAQARQQAQEKPVEFEVKANIDSIVNATEEARNEIESILEQSAKHTIQYEQDIELILNPVNSIVSGVIDANFNQEQAFDDLEKNIENTYSLVEQRRQDAEDKAEEQFDAGLDKIIGSSRNAEQIQKNLSESAEKFDSQIVVAFENYEKASENATDAEKSELFDAFIKQREQILENKNIERRNIIENSNLSKLKRDELHQLNIDRAVAQAEIDKAFIDDKAAAEELAATQRAALERKFQQQQILQYTKILKEQQEAAKDVQNQILEDQIEFSKNLTDSLNLDNERDNLDFEFKFNRQNIQENLQEELQVMQNSLNRFAENIGVDIPVNLSAGEQAEFLQNQVSVLEQQLLEELPNLTDAEAELRKKQIEVLKNLLNDRTAIIVKGNNAILEKEIEYQEQLNKLRDEQIKEERKAFDEQANLYKERADKIFDIVRENEAIVDSIINSSDTQALGGIVDGAAATLVGLRSLAQDLLGMTDIIKQGFNAFQDMDRAFADAMQGVDDAKDKLGMIDEELAETEENLENATGELKKTLEEKRKALLRDRNATMEYIKSIEGNNMQLEAEMKRNNEEIQKQKDILNDPNASKEAKQVAEQNLKDLEENNKNIENQIKKNLKNLKKALTGDWEALKELIFDAASAITKAVFDSLQKSSQATIDSLDRVIAKQQERTDKVREGLEEGGEAAKNLTAEQLEIEEARLQKLEEQRREELQKQQNFTTAQIALQGAIAVARALATLPPPLSFIVAAATTAALFAQIAAVRSRAQGAVQAEHGATVLEGGKIRQRGKNNGGTITGRRHSTGGVLIEAEDGEDIMSRKVTREFRDVLDMMHDGQITRKDLVLSKDVKKMNISELIKNKTFNDTIFNSGSLRTSPVIINNQMDTKIFDSIRQELSELRLDIKRNSRTDVNSYMDGKKVTDIITKRQKKKDIIKNKAKRR